MSEPIIWLCRVIGFFFAFVGIYGSVVLLPTIWNFKEQDDDRNF